MRAWTSKDFRGLWPVGTAAVVVAPDEATARDLLRQATPFREDDFTLVELDLSQPNAVVLCDGDY